MNGELDRSPRAPDAAPPQARSAPDRAPQPPARGWRALLAAARFVDADRLLRPSPFGMPPSAPPLDARPQGDRPRVAEAAPGTAPGEALGDAPERVDERTRASVALLAELQTLLRSKAYARARRRLEEHDDAAPLLDWAALERELEQLADAAEALDRREPEQAEERLRGVEGRFFPAEYETQLGTLRSYDGEMEAAGEHFRRALEHDPEHIRAMVNLGNVELEAGRLDEAVERYQRALKLDENFANAHHNLGVAYRRRGDYGKSVRSLRRAQRASQRQQREEARDKLRGTGASVNWLRWLLIGAAGVALLVFLRAQGML